MTFRMHVTPAKLCIHCDCQRGSNAILPAHQQCDTFLAMPSSSQTPQACRLLYAGCPPACSSESSGIRWQLTGPVWQCDSAKIGARCRQVRAAGDWLCQVCQTILPQCTICIGPKQLTNRLQAGLKPEAWHCFVRGQGERSSSHLYLHFVRTHSQGIPTRETTH